MLFAAPSFGCLHGGCSGLGIAADEPLSFGAILDVVVDGCAKQTDAFRILTVQFLATATNYFKVREQSMRSIGNDDAASAYEAAYNTMAGHADRWTHGGASCDELRAAILWFMQTMGDDPRDATYVEMNRELRSYYAAVQSGSPTIPPPEPPQPAPKPPTGKTPWLAIGGVLAGVALAGVAVVVIAGRKTRRRG